jgi:signal transduction histidine kinase
MKKLGAVTQIEYHLGNAYKGLHDAYQLSNQFDSAYKYIALAQMADDSINQRRIKSLAEFQKLSLDEQQRLQNLEKERVVYQNKVRTYFMLAGITVLLLLAIIFFRNNRQKHKAKIKIEQAYDNLKATQQQLIQSEKMASLGELTAGIAHEIQNPLNFVNNFSEVNKELLAEMNEEIQKGNFDEVKAIAKDVTDNEEKINYHGKRADAIVKGMLQHSRSSSGVKEPTNINALADEYLRLAYHGLRAKDKSFNATLKTEYDESIGNINIVPQDIGRVILNLITNAFYAVAEKKRQREDGYEPTVSVSTTKVNGKVEVKVKDNGNGIPQKVLDKIFQPFFTTKPTGQGTGLGLSLSYDIVKAHGGELKVETKEGEGSEFIIQLPNHS